MKPSPSQRLAVSLVALKALQEAGCVAIRSQDLSRVNRERLLRHGFLREVMKGWYVPTRPDEPPGESTAWVAAFWPYCASYLASRFEDAWCVSPEQSLRIHTGDWTVPRQLLVRSPLAGNKPTALLHDTSIFDLRLALPEASALTVIDGIRVYRLPAALVACSAAHYTAQPTDMRVALSMIGDASELLRLLLDRGHTVIAGRLAGALRNIGRGHLADQILGAMRAAGHTVVETDPFEAASPVALHTLAVSPHVNRLHMTWERMRATVLQCFPAPSAPALSTFEYLRQMDANYVSDAYHSLSIEGYQVTTALIERVRSGRWNPDADADDRQHRDALAARGYWQAFQAVRESIEQVLAGQNAGAIADRDHPTWYRELFGPSVTAGILRPADLAGYRSAPVHIRRSMHTPPRADAVRDVMPALFERLQQETAAPVRVVLGHFFFVAIHPYLDGNGRMGRFLMNVMLASGGYPWMTVPLERRSDYIDALERASVHGDIEPFATFLASLLRT